LPAFRTKIEPKHPRAARLAQKEGKVVLEATIDLDGKAKDIVIKADTVGFGCARAAIDALEASLFSPAKRGGENVSIRIAIPYQFKLEE
jgi:TonB family protein